MSKERYVVEMIGLDRVMVERVRASLRGSPFHVQCSEDGGAAVDPAADGPAADGADLYVIRADLLDGALRRPAPVIASGPPGLLRSAFLAGCADYLREPWTPEEFAARLRRVLSREERRWHLPWGIVSLEGGRLVLPGGGVALTYRESQVLRTLLHSRGTPVSRHDLGYAAQGRPQRAGGRSLDVLVSALRRKVRRAEPRSGCFIVSVRGRGYMIP